MNILELREKVKLLPAKPGCYIMKNESGTVIYVGKAKKLRNRVKSYFDNSSKTQKTYALVKNIVDFEYIITPSELDAFSLENNLIKKYKPKYNILLKDDKSFPYIKIDMAEKFPRIQIVRRPKKDGSMLFGPYVTGVPISELMNIIKSAFPVRWCNKDFSKAKFPCKACLHGELGQCMAPCADESREKEYKKVVLKVVDFLNGDTKQVRANLTAKMNAYAKTENFEEALKCRNHLEMIDRLEGKIITSLTTSKNIDVFAYYDSQTSGLSAINAMTIRAGQTIGETNYIQEDVVGSTEEILTSFLVEYYRGIENLPNEIVCKQLTEESAELISLYFLNTYQKVVKVTIPQKAIKNELFEQAYANAKEYCERSSDSFARKQKLTSGALESLAKLLGLNSVYRIEGYDISDISGTNNVASMVVFEGGEPNKKLYRKFKIKTVEGANDFACMKEALSRRLSRLASGDTEFGEKPDVILIDGGLGQLNSVKDLASQMGLNITFISLAKQDEEIYTTTSNAPIRLPRTDYALRLLQRVRDESHRFAVLYHRNVRGNTELASQLAEIEGVGKHRQQILYKHFKTIDAIADASVEELAKVEGIGAKNAINIYNYFHKN
ncbi:MAG: excinuclease ABC subunit UvrC [Clostridia bacterium]|nr:excinuclease ABC subunit UvrC [Clostridia bacterium]